MRESGKGNKREIKEGNNIASISYLISEQEGIVIIIDLHILSNTKLFPLEPHILDPLN